MTAQVERLYEVFAAPRPRVVEFCDHCVSAAADAIDADFFWLRMATGTHERGDQREKRAIEEYFEATPRALAALVQEELRNSSALDEGLAEWLHGPGPLARLEECALDGPDADGVCSEAHLVLEAWRSEHTTH